MAEESGSRGLADRALALIASGQAVSRTELARHLGAAPSTVSTTVQQLLSRGLVIEEGSQPSGGGRPRKVLRVGNSGGYALAADVGRHHLRVARVRAGGRTESIVATSFDVSTGPEEGLAVIGKALRGVVQGASGSLRAVGVSLPGPVDVAIGGVYRPSSMPGWDGFRVRDWLEEQFGVPAVVENDANLMAIGENAARRLDHQNSITIKAGSAIGAGVIIEGRLHRGATGAAGDITHVRVEAAEGIPCSCGNVGCLETVASGAALVDMLSEQGAKFADVVEVVDAARNGHSQATTAVRQAGALLGEVLSANVNFFNPHAVYLGGILSTLEPFVASVRSRLYDGCHPIVTQQLTIEPTLLGIDTGLVGAGVHALQDVMSQALA